MHLVSCTCVASADFSSDATECMKGFACGALSGYAVKTDTWKGSAKNAAVASACGVSLDVIQAYPGWQHAMEEGAKASQSQGLALGGPFWPCVTRTREDDDSISFQSALIGCGYNKATLQEWMNNVLSKEGSWDELAFNVGCGHVGEINGLALMKNGVSQ